MKKIVPHVNSERRMLVALVRRAALNDLAIGQWWTGPGADKYYVLDLCSQQIVAGQTGMSIAELTAWFWRLDLKPNVVHSDIGASFAA